MRTLIWSTTAATLALAGASEAQPSGTRMIGRGETLTISSTGEKRTVSGGGTLVVQRGGEPTLQGSGVLISQMRAVGPFDAVLADDGVDIEIVLGAERSLEVLADDNLIARVTTTVQGGQLSVGVTGSYATRTPPVVRLTTPSLSEVTLQSSSHARLKGLAGGALRLESYGSGGFTGQGRLDSVVVRLNGSGDAGLAGVAAEDADVEMNGSGTAVVRVSRSLEAEANGSGTITYLGDPVRVRTSAHGTGAVVHAAR